MPPPKSKGLSVDWEDKRDENQSSKRFYFNRSFARHDHHGDLIDAHLWSSLDHLSNAKDDLRSNGVARDRDRHFGSNSRRCLSNLHGKRSKAAHLLYRLL